MGNFKKKKIQSILLINLLLISIAILNVNNYSSNIKSEKNNDGLIESDDSLISPESSATVSATYAEIEIDDYGPKNPGAYSWSEAFAQGICTGSGTILDPYVIDGQVISDSDGLGGCIEIRESNAHFIIQNCILTNSTHFGIKLNEAHNGTLLNNECSNNNYGIQISSSKNCTVSGNTLNNDNFGLSITGSYNVTASGNTMTLCGLTLGFFDSKAQMDTMYIDTSNTANGKPIYYYKDKTDLKKNDFDNAAQVILVNCSDSLIADINVSYASRGISLFHDSSNVSLSNITSNYGADYGLYIRDCNNITLYNNSVSYNKGTGISCNGDDYNLTKNVINYNGETGLYLSSKNANLSDNILVYNRYGGIQISGENCILKNNDITWGGIDIYGNEQELGSHSIDTSNTVNSKKIYYYPQQTNLKNTDFTDAGQIILVSCNDSFISYYNISYVSKGISIYHSENITIYNCNISENIENGLHIEYSSKCNFSVNTANKINGTAFYFMYECNFNKILGNTINNNSGDGIYLFTKCSNNTITGNTVNNTRNGITVYTNCDDNNITGNDICYTGKYTSLSKAILLSDTDRCNVSGNVINNNYYRGIYIQNGINNTISNNEIKENSDFGLYLYYGEGHNITKNTLVGCGLGINPDNTISKMTSNYIDQSNTVNGKTLYYYANEVGLDATSFSNAGQIFLINCSYATIVNVNVSRGSTGITLYFSENNTIMRVNATHNQHYGIYLYRSSKNNITESMFTNNNKIGVYLSYICEDNQIYANVFINNTLNNAEDYGSNNKWNNATIGNYWDDYTGCDNNNDGIGESAYIIPGTAGSQDDFPITNRKCTPSSSGGDDDDEEEPQVVQIPGYDIILIIAIICVATLILTQNKFRIYK